MAMGKKDLTGENYECAFINEITVSDDFIHNFMDLDELFAATTAVSSSENGRMQLRNDKSNLCSGVNNSSLSGDVKCSISDILGEGCGIIINTGERKQIQDPHTNDDEGMNKMKGFAKTGGNNNDNGNAKLQRTGCSRQQNSTSATGKSSQTSHDKEAAKDKKYWERRMKNNIAAKRSRDAKRVKEASTIERWKLLEEENVRLKTEISNTMKRTETLESKLGETYKCEI